MIGEEVFMDARAQDPDPHGCVIATETRVVLVEGLYTLISRGGFAMKPGIFDAEILIDTPKSANRVTPGYAACSANAIWSARAPVADGAIESYNRSNCFLYGFSMSAADPSLRNAWLDVILQAESVTPKKKPRLGEAVQCYPLNNP